ncbi:MAG: single-stranded-DNA-specific exonuclease RecJ [Oscillospiraceae bacterium]|nr:single-stranded-DNA-specific exonuclease RecJ [Oscillospiraceae bacterium]
MKYGVWNIGEYDRAAWQTVCAAGYAPLTAAVLCSRGCDTPEKAAAYLARDAKAEDPFLLKDMGAAAARVRKALAFGETIAVYGDYDVDGITSTCLLTDYLRRKGATVVPYIPARLEEGYGLNETAIRYLAEQGVQLIITVDCGITAVAEAELCRELGMELIVTDHHECKDVLPTAAAVVDPHRRDDTYPHKTLAGVGVAFKLAAAVEEDQDAVLETYCDLVCLGTVADVMTLTGENRMFVTRGIARLQEHPRVGITALIRECGCEDTPVSASLIGYTLAPRINAAGRMGRVMVAVDLFLTDDPAVAAEKAAQLCEMNRERQAVESEIYDDAKARLAAAGSPNVIVLAGENWHQGVVGIVASRLAEEYACPTFLICMDGDKGKASSRSYGGFHLFRSLEQVSELLEGFGGHELAAGFTISRENIDAFAAEMDRLVREFRAEGVCREALNVDCAVTPSLLTVDDVASLSALEPCGAGCPRPTLAMTQMRVTQLAAVGSGRHLRLRLQIGDTELCGIYFSMTAQRAHLAEGDIVDVAFLPQINEFRGQRSVQLNVVDIRPSSSAAPSRERFVSVWKYLAANAQAGEWNGTAQTLARGAARLAKIEENLLKTQVCLDVFEELGLLTIAYQPEFLTITLRTDRKVSLDNSRILRHLKAGDKPDGAAGSTV